MNNKLSVSTATELIQLIRDSSVTSSEIAESILIRIRHLDTSFHAWLSIDEEYVLLQAKKIDNLIQSNSKMLLLPSIPIGIKDVFNTEHYPTQKGSRAWVNYKAGNDARCVSYLRNEGALIVGKTDTAELAVHANGKALNPYNLLHNTGSSSGGSAVAVSTAMVPVALGTQTGGSIIRPASWCGIYAMKPSFGLIPRTGVLKTTDTLDSIGFFARCVEDLKLLLEVLRIHGVNFPIQERELNKYRNSINHNKWRIAICNHPTLNSTQSYVLKSLQKVNEDLATLKEVEVVNIDLPESTFNNRELHRRIYHPCLAYYLKTEFEKDPCGISNSLMNIFEDAKSIPPEDYSIALKEQAELANDLEKFFSQNKIDAVLINSSNGSAPYGSEPEVHFDLNSLWTMAWLPVINVPKFKCNKGLPFGVQLVGPRYSDYKLLALLEYFCQTGFAPTTSEIAISSARSVIDHSQVVC